MPHQRVTQQQLSNQFLSKRIKLGNGIEIRPVTTYIFDVFKGNGWTAHARYQRVQGRWLHTSGTKLSEAEYKQVVDAL